MTLLALDVRPVPRSGRTRSGRCRTLLTALHDRYPRVLFPLVASSTLPADRGRVDLMRWRPVVLVPHTRQFLVGRSPRLVNADWLAREIGPGLWLSHCPRLPVAEGPDGLVLGVAVGAGRGLRPDRWSGRWVLIRDGILTLDACGTLGVFFADGWVSSSPALLAGEREAPLVEEPGVMNWYPPPRSGKWGVSRLLPSQTLDLRTFRLGRRPLLTDPPADPAQLLVDAASRLAGPLWLPLTGGVDSRTLLAVAAAAGLDVTTYTFVGVPVPEADRNLPPRLAAAVGFRHRQIRWQAEDPGPARCVRPAHGRSPPGWAAAADRPWAVGPHTAERDGHGWQLLRGRAPVLPSVPAPRCG